MYLELSKEKAYSAETFEELDVGNTDVGYTIVAYDQLFNTEMVKELIDHGICAVPEECKPAVLAMLKFLRDKKHHQEALCGMKGVGDTATLTAVMAQHLFSPLIAGNDYLMDNRSENLPRYLYCPCEKENCKALMKSGCTAIGSPETWHGYVDIILNQNVAASLLECPSKEETKLIKRDDYPDDCEEDEPSDLFDDDFTVEEVGPTRIKRICMKNDDTEEGDTLNMTSQHKEDKSMKEMDQLIAQTITNAFSQVNKTPALSGWLIPTIGCTLDHVTALFYDPENDVLLQSVDRIPIWGFNGLYIPSIVQIWMFLNFTFFTFKDLADIYELNRSNFHSHAKNRLKDFRKMKCGKALNFICDFDYHSDVLTKMRKKGKKAEKTQREH